MPRLSPPRTGEELNVKGRTLPFSFWPVYRNSHRYGVRSTRSFVSNPWLLIRRSIRAKLPAGSGQFNDAIAFTDQAEDYFRVAGDANLLAAKPVLLYYGLMNLAKAFIISNGVHASLDNVYHGLTTSYGPPRHEFLQATLTIKRTTPTLINVFDSFALALGTPIPATVTSYRIPQLAQQDILGNQLNSIATGDVQRFFKIESVQFMHDKLAKQIWLRLFVYADERMMQGQLSVTNLLTRTGLSGLWHQVTSERSVPGRTLDCIEQVGTIAYTGRPSDNVSMLIEVLKPFLWTIALSDYPFRQYYLYADSSPGRTDAVPQLISVFALMFFFGSVTRYRPNLFREILTGSHGAQVEEFLGNQPSQFLYLLASEFQDQDVAQGALL